MAGRLAGNILVVVSNVFHVQGLVTLYPGALQAFSPLMAPNHGAIPIVGQVAGHGDHLEVILRFQIDGDPGGDPFLHRLLTSYELADAWELAHHQHHGYDPRGLDPRVGPTRLKP